MMFLVATGSDKDSFYLFYHGTDPPPYLDGQHIFWGEMDPGRWAGMLYEDYLAPDSYIPMSTPESKRTNIPTSLRWKVWERDNFTCKHCGSRRNLSIDHIIPESKDGLTILENLQTLCRSCNSKKGARRDINAKTHTNR